MLVIPAIDIKDGKVVRLLQGRFDESIVYSHDPLETAKVWQKDGADRIHFVDLDGARTGEVKSIAVLREIVGNIKIPVQFGGGLRSREDISSVLSAGAKWAVVGTKACEDLSFINEIVNEVGEQIIASIDVKFKQVATHGWAQISETGDVDLIRKLKDIGIKLFIYTDISRDGTLRGPNIKEIKRVLQETEVSMFYSGGISSLEDIKNLKTLESNGLVGVIIGKALYEDRIHLMQVKRILGGKGEEFEV
jgi:phosphoribosylformimino-5-aminoimidazole carboxamide ribotide isomerase